MKKSDSRSVRRFYLSLHFGFVFPAFLQKAMINTRPDVKESPKQVRESVGVYCFAAQPIARGTFTGLSYLYCALRFFSFKNYQVCTSYQTGNVAIVLRQVKYSSKVEDPKREQDAVHGYQIRMLATSRHVE